jgi:hypothetical protein
MDAGSLVAADKLIDPKETALFAASSAVEKIPPGLVDHARKAVFESLARLKQDSDRGGPNSVAFAAALESLVRRQWTAVEKEGDQLGAKLRLDTKTATLDQEYSLTGKAGTTLAKDIEAWAKPKENRFTGLADKSAAAQLFAKLPLFTSEVKDIAAAAIAALENGAKDHLPEPAHPLVTELIAGLTRTAKSGDADLAAVLHGPDAAGTFTAVAAVSLDDAPKVEAELKKLVKAIGPKNLQDAIAWDVAKSGTANLHEMKIDDFLPAEAKKVFGDKAVLVVGFDKNSVFVGLGPDARAKVTAAAVLKPTGAGTGPTVLFDTAYNPAKVQKLIMAIDARAAGWLETALGNDDALAPLFRATVAGGAKLTVTQSVSLKFYGMLFFVGRLGGP